MPKKITDKYGRKLEVRRQSGDEGDQPKGRRYERAKRELKKFQPNLKMELEGIIVQCICYGIC